MIIARHPQHVDPMLREMMRGLAAEQAARTGPARHRRGRRDYVHIVRHERT
jgi:hypothetical protein